MEPQTRLAHMVIAAMGWKGLSGPDIERNGSVSRATIDRIKRGQPVGDTTLRRLETALELPRDFLLYVRDGDVAAIRKAAQAVGDEDLSRWAIHHLFTDPD